MILDPGQTQDVQLVLWTGPDVASVSPANGSLAGGTSVVINGSNFTGATAVKFGPSHALSFTVDSDTQITAVSPPGLGTVDVTVTTPHGHLGGLERRSIHLPHPAPNGHRGKPHERHQNRRHDSLSSPVSTSAGATSVRFGSNSATSLHGRLHHSDHGHLSEGSTGTVDITVTTAAGISDTMGRQSRTPAATEVVVTMDEAERPCRKRLRGVHGMTLIKLLVVCLTVSGSFGGCDARVY